MAWARRSSKRSSASASDSRGARFVETIKRIGQRFAQRVGAKHAASR
jgi:hypothetical protein